MKPEKIVAKIVETSEYCKLVELWSLENGNGEHLPSEKVVKMFLALNRKIDDEKKSFFRTFGLKSQANIINFKVPRDVQATKDEFDRELNRQMPDFIDLMNRMPIQVCAMPIQIHAV